MNDCSHDLPERETVFADGFCPICLKEKIEQLREEIGKAVAFLESEEVYDKIARHNSLLILLAALEKK